MEKIEKTNILNKKTTSSANQKKTQGFPGAGKHPVERAVMIHN